MKTKLGITAGLLGACAYFMAMFGGYVALLVLAGYVLLSESNEWLRRTVVKAIVLALAVNILCALINLLPDALNVIDRMARIFGGYLNTVKVMEFMGFLTDVVRYIGDILFLILGFSAFKQGHIRIPLVDSFLDRHI